jgi:hypothetical protein
MTPMNRILNAFLILPLLAAFAIAGCGGGGAFSVAEGGIGGTGISTGTVTGIGSITVNGVKFNTDNAAIYIEGTRVDDPDLADGDELSLRGFGFNEGQVVRVVGSFNDDGKTGTAEEVYFNDSVEGPVESVTQIDAITQELVVMGQTVIVDSQTKPAGVNLDTFNIDDLVEVSGLMDELGRIRAGYLEIKGTFTNGEDAEVKGIVTGDTGNSFIINGLTVNYSGAIELPVGGIQNGMQVEVKGTYDGQLDAVTIELEDDIGGGDDDDVEYEGIVSDAAGYTGAGGSFTLGTKEIQTSTSTIFKGGLDTDVVLGARLEAEGYLSAGVLIAKEISFKDAIEIDARVDATSVNPSGDIVTFNLEGLGNLTVQVNRLSKISGATDFNNLVTKLNGGAVDYIKVRGRDISSGAPVTILAEEIEIDEGNTDTKVKIQGPVIDSEPVVTILGIDIDVTDPSNSIEYEDINEQLISEAVFFASIEDGDIVGAEGELDGSGVVTWDKLEIEDEE